MSSLRARLFAATLAARRFSMILLASFAALALLLSSVGIYGVTFGLLALGSGLSVLDALLMSATVYSGTAQVANGVGIFIAIEAAHGNTAAGVLRGDASMTALQTTAVVVPAGIMKSTP